MEIQKTAATEADVGGRCFYPDSGTFQERSSPIKNLTIWDENVEIEV